MTALPATARDGGAKSRIEITKLRTHLAKGKVSSGKERCERDRKVSLFTYDGFISDKVAITYSNREGIWKVTRSLKPGRYFAKVEHSRGCRYDVSHNKVLRD